MIFGVLIHLMRLEMADETNRLNKYYVNVFRIYSRVPSRLNRILYNHKKYIYNKIPKRLVTLLTIINEINTIIA